MKHAHATRIAALMARPVQSAKAFSYLRFSTPEQMRGDSQQRQLRLARDYAKQHGLELDETLTYADRGVSAYRGANASKEGALGFFLESVRAGTVPTGSFLLVENLDRLSRQTARKALRTLEDIIDAGITVVTLMDGRHYTAESLDTDGFSLMLALLTMMRAHEESATKSRRAKEAYRSAVERARKGEGRAAYTHPSWLRYDDAAKAYVAVPERAEVVRRVFSMARQGVGKDSIAATLNKEGVPVFGRGRRWYGSFILKLLNNRAVLGELHPQEFDRTGDKPVVVKLPVLKGYYPAVVKKAEFERISALAGAAANPRRGRHAAAGVSNILGGLSRCPKCGEAMTRVNKGGNGGVPYLVCAKAKSGDGCQYHTVRYRDVENALFEGRSALVGLAPAATAAGNELHGRLNAIESAQSTAADSIENLTEALEKAKGDNPAAIVSRISELQDELQRLTDEASGIQKQLAASGPSVIEARLRELSESLKEPRDLTRANSILRLLVQSVVVDYQSGSLEFLWRHGGGSRLSFAWPEETRQGGRRRSRKKA